MIDKITERKSLFWNKTKELEESKGSVYLYGAGAAAHNIESQLRERKITVSGMAVDQEYYTEELKDAGVLCLNRLLESADQKVNLIQATAKYNRRMFSAFKEKIGTFLRFDIFHPSHLSEDEIFMDYNWVTKHEKELSEVYGLLEDELSREIFVAYLNQRISGDFIHLSGKTGGRQYFDSAVMPLDNSEVLIDCGAYNGDSAASFVEELHSRGIHDYCSIYSFEPDQESFQEMKERDIQKHICIPKGVSDQCGEISFSAGNGVGSSVGSGDSTVQVDSIDHVLRGKAATIIKMDIEGSEMKALVGAQKTLREHKPKLAICIYHKDEDLYMIPQYVKALVPEYRLYIRIYEEYVNELVLYAIPEE